MILSYAFSFRRPRQSILVSDCCSVYSKIKRNLFQKILELHIILFPLNCKRFKVLLFVTIYLAAVLFSLRIYVFFSNSSNDLHYFLINRSILHVVVSRIINIFIEILVFEKLLYLRILVCKQRQEVKLHLILFLQSQNIEDISGVSLEAEFVHLLSDWQVTEWIGRKRVESGTFESSGNKQVDYFSPSELLFL